MSPLTLSLLDGFELQTSLGRLLVVPTRKAQALLAYLALTPGQAHPRDKLAAFLWGELSPAAARNALRQSLFVLRKALGEMELGLLVSSGDAVTLVPDALPTDVIAFERAVAEASPTALERAAGLYRGDLLAGLGLDEPAFEDWLMSERERLRELALEGFARLLAHQRASGAAAAAVQTALRLLALDPLQEAVHRALMRLYGQLGRRDAALRQYQECLEVLHRELNVEPELETKELYGEILRQRPVRAAVPPAPMPGRSFEAPIVGRDLEVTRLFEALGEGWTGHGRLAAVLGEAGIGKSRLLAELAVEAGRRAGAVLLGRAYESEQILPFGPWVDALREGGVFVDARSLDSLGTPWLAELVRLFPELADSGVPAAADTGDHLRLFEALARLFRHLALPRPLLVVLEDIHWADDMSLRFLAFLGRRLHEAPILVAISAREEELADSPVLRRTLDELAGEQRLSRLTLARLGRDDTMALVRSLGRVDSRAATQAQLDEQVWEASAGNPFIVVETVRAIREGVTVAAAGGLPFSTRVRDMIARRLDRLGPRGRQLASVAAVIGREFDFTLLARAADLPDLQTADAVEELVRRKILFARGDHLDFTHDRIREVAYGGLLVPKRRALHAAVARALEATHTDRLEAVYDRLAYHYCEADDTPNAVEYLTRFARHAARGFAYADALSALEQALARAQRLPDGERDRHLLDIVPRMARALSVLGRVQDALDLLDRHKARIEAIDNPLVTGRYCLLLANTYNFRPGDERTVRSARRAIEEATRCGDHATTGKASYVLAFTSLWSGQFRRGVEHGLAAASLLERSKERWWEGQARWMVAVNLTLLGEFDAALEAAAASRAVGEAINDPRVLSSAARIEGVIRALRGEWQDGIAACQYALEQAPDLYNTAESLCFLGVAYLEAGDTTQAVAVLQRAVQQESEFQARTDQGWFNAWLGEAYLLDGQADKAGQSARQGLELARKAGYRVAEGSAQRVLGNVFLDMGNLSEAAIHLSGALEIFEAIEAPYFKGRTHQDLARLAHAREDEAAVKSNLREAELTFARLRALAHLERTKRLHVELQVRAGSA